MTHRESPSPASDRTDRPADPSGLDPLVARLAGADGPADAAGVWPAELWEAMVEAGAPGWSIDLAGDRAELVRRYARLAEGSLTAAFILTQHDAAVRRLAAVQTPRARSWLDEIAAGRAFATVGISQLTTSRRLGTQAMRAEETAGGFRFDGAMPWVTAAERADVFVTGAVLADGRQVLVALPRDRAGVVVRPAFELAALQASRTGEVACEGALVEPEEVLYGPADDVIAIPGLAGTGGLETSALALGQSRAALDGLEAIRAAQPDLDEPVEALRRDWEAFRDDLFAAARSDPAAPKPAELRATANAFVLRATQAFLTASKGAGFLRSEPAQRWARQALFFLVWSCPTPVARAAIRDFAGVCPA